jgi:hypothetical protein
MSDLGSQPREVWKQPGRLPAEGRLGSSENTRQSTIFVACLALFAYVPLVWHSEPSILDLNLNDADYGPLVHRSQLDDFNELATATPGVIVT